MYLLDLLCDLLDTCSDMNNIVLFDVCMYVLYYVVCMVYVCCMYVVCILYVCCMYVVCMLYVCCMYVVCMLYVCIHTCMFVCFYNLSEKRM